jgi:hypothetical protein
VSTPWIETWKRARPGRAVRRAVAVAAFSLASLALLAEAAGAVLRLAGFPLGF